MSDAWPWLSQPLVRALMTAPRAPSTPEDWSTLDDLLVSAWFPPTGKLNAWSTVATPDPPESMA